MTHSQILYAITPKDLAGHLFQVSLSVDAPAAEGQVFALPAWIPGSYMIREFARNIVQIRAESAGKPVALAKLTKDSWQAAPCKGALTLHYEVYAWDLSVRTAHLDQSHGFFNGTSVFLRVLGQEDSAHVVDIVCPGDPACQDWRVATAMPELHARRYGFGTYVAADYDELIDHPVEMGGFALGTFAAHGTEHDVVITGRVPNLDMPRLCADLKRICETQIAFFEPKTKRAPCKRYVFMTMAVGDGYGGLEHRASTSLVCKRSDLPALAAKDKAKDKDKDKDKDKTELSEGYRAFLGLCSHEYFHTWNVKRIKPAQFAPYDLQTEAYTSLLWLFEGFTSYYDDLMLLRSGLIDEAAYLKLVAKTVNVVLGGSGRHKQSVAESSFDAWIKFYRKDENAPNAVVSYYAKGSLVALALDLMIRDKTKGKKSLDDVMLLLWQRHGRDFYEHAANRRGVGDAEVAALFDEVGGAKFKSFFERHVYGTEDLPLAKLYAPFGVDYTDKRKDAKLGLDAQIANEGGMAKLAQVFEGGVAHLAGLSAGDLLMAVDGLRVSMNGAASNLDTLLARYASGAVVTIHAFRRDELISVSACLAVDGAPHVELALSQTDAKAARKGKADGVKLKRPSLSGAMDSPTSRSSAS